MGVHRQGRHAHGLGKGVLELLEEVQVQHVLELHVRMRRHATTSPDLGGIPPHPMIRGLSMENLSCTGDRTIRQKNEDPRNTDPGILGERAGGGSRSEGFPAGPLFEPPVPDVTVDRSLDLPVGRRTLRLVHTPGHARDHLSVEGPGGAWLWAGDLLSDLEIPFVSDRLAAYEETLASLAAMDISLLVPGHGALTADPAEIAARLREDRAYLAELRRRVAPVVAVRGTVQDAAAACAGMVFRRREANAEAHAMNVEQAFCELGGFPSSPSLGWAREL